MRMNAFWIALRSLLRRPAFAVTAVLTLALGISVTTTMFSMVDTVLLKPLPFPDGGQLVTVMEANPSKNQKTSLIAPGRLEDWNRESQTFAAISGSYAENVTDTSGREPERLAARRVAPRYFVVYGMAPQIGRTFWFEEERFGGSPSAVISDGLWTRRYNRDPRVLTQRLVLGGIGYSIIGVMPGAFTSTPIDIWLPAQTPPGLLRVREARFLSGVGRMKPGVTIAQATADIVRVQQMLGERFPASDRGWSASVSDMKEGRVGAYRQTLWVVFAAVALLLIIGVANVAGLMLVQLHRRAGELAIRQAIGGSRLQIVLAVMREVLLVAGAGLIGGATLAVWLVRIVATTFASVPRMNELTLDWRALAFTTAAIVGAALVFGLLPALNATRQRATPLLAHAGSRVAAGRHRPQQALVVAQIALGILLASSAALMLRSYHNLTRVESGFNTDHTITFHVGAAWNEDRTRIGQLQERLVAELQELPSVVDAGITNFLPATGATLRYQISIEGLATADDNGKITVGERTVSAGYLRALEVPLVAGSWCPPLHTDFTRPTKAMVNRAFADRYGRDVVGRHFAFDQIPGSHEIVGIVGNVIEDGVRASAAPYVYACQSAGDWPDPEYVVRARGDARAVMASVREIVHRLDAGRAIFGVQSLDAVMAGTLDQPRLDAGMLSLLAAAAIGLASLGLYSLLMLLVAERTRELGVRMALGAAPVQVVALIFAGAARLLAAGIALGLLLTAAGTQLLDAALFAVAPLDAATLALALTAFSAVVIVAAAIPAMRAARIDPIGAIRPD